MRKQNPAEPTPFEAVCLEPDSLWRESLIDKANAIWQARLGPQLEAELVASRDAVALYTQSLRHQLQRPDVKPLMPHREGMRAMAEASRLRKEYEALRDYCLRWAREALFAETGRRVAESKWPSQREVPPTANPDDRELEQRKLPDPREVWPTAVRRTPGMGAPRAGEIPCSSDEYQSQLQELDSMVELLVEKGRKGPLSEELLADLKAGIQEGFPNHPQMWTSMMNEVNRRLVDPRA